MRPWVSGNLSVRWSRLSGGHHCDTRRSACADPSRSECRRDFCGLRGDRFRSLYCSLAPGKVPTAGLTVVSPAPGSGGRGDYSILLLGTVTRRPDSLERERFVGVDLRSRAWRRSHVLLVQSECSSTGRVSGWSFPLFPTVFIAVVAYFLLGEHLLPYHLTGAFFIMVGVLLVMLLKPGRARS